MEWLLGPRWDAGKFKTALKLCVKRMSLVSNKGEATRRAKEREVAELIKDGSVELARIQCETLLRLSDEKEVMQKLTVYSELASARVAMIDAAKEVPVELSTPLCSLVFAGPRFQNIDEMATIAKLLTAKFGKPFAEAARANEMACVDPSIVHRLSGGTPDPFLVSVMMRKVAAQVGGPNSFGAFGGVVDGRVGGCKIYVCEVWGGDFQGLFFWRDPLDVEGFSKKKKKKKNSAVVAPSFGFSRKKNIISLTFLPKSTHTHTHTHTHTLFHHHSST
jgi:hypothetical protein